MSSRKKKTVRKARVGRGSSRAGAGKKTARKKTARKKPARRKLQRRAAPPPPPTPVVTLPKKYDKYFQKMFGGSSIHPAAITFCCGSAPQIPEDDASIGQSFGALTTALASAEPELGINQQEIQTIENWPPDQLRTLRSAFLEIFYPVATCRAPKKARFRGRHTPGSKNIRVAHGDVIEVTFSGP